MLWRHFTLTTRYTEAISGYVRAAARHGLAVNVFVDLWVVLLMLSLWVWPFLFELAVYFLVGRVADARAEGALAMVAHQQYVAAQAGASLAAAPTANPNGEPGELPPPGWYRDMDDPDLEVWWTGVDWSEIVRGTDLGRRRKREIVPLGEEELAEASKGAGKPVSVPAFAPHGQDLAITFPSVPVADYVDCPALDVSHDDGVAHVDLDTDDDDGGPDDTPDGGGSGGPEGGPAGGPVGDAESATMPDADSSSGEPVPSA